MVTKNTLLSSLPIRLKLIAYCYACAQVIPVDQKKYEKHTVHEVSEQMNCPTCKAGNLGIRPVLKYNRMNLRKLFHLFKPKKNKPNTS